MIIIVITVSHKWGEASSRMLDANFAPLSASAQTICQSPQYSRAGCLWLTRTSQNAKIRQVSAHNQPEATQSLLDKAPTGGSTPEGVASGRRARYLEVAPRNTADVSVSRPRRAADGVQHRRQRFSTHHACRIPAAGDLHPQCVDARRVRQRGLEE